MTGSHSRLGISDRQSCTTGVIRAYDTGVRGVSDSPEGMTPQSLAPKDQMTPPWKK